MTGLIARSGRFVLVLGLLVGIAFPSAAAALEPFVPQMVALLLCLNAFRNAPAIAQGMGSGLGRSAVTIPITILALQLALPLVVLWALMLAGIPFTGFTIALVLMLSAPALVGSPNLVAMTGHDPGPSMRMLIIGTLVFPLTAFIALFALPGIETGAAAMTTLILAMQILLVVALGIALRAIATGIKPDWDPAPLCDEATAALLAIIVVGLMADVGPLLRSAPMTLLIWLGGVMALNFGLQIITFFGARRFGLRAPVATAVYAGNRNTALYFLALPAELIDQLMLFIGCYQIPMYLTPIVMRRLYGSAR